MDQARKKQPPNPRDDAGFINRMVFWWIIPFLRLGNRRPLIEDDLYTVQSQDASVSLGNRIQREWDKELEESKIKKRKASYVKALARCFGWDFASVGILAAIEECVLRIAQPLLLGGLVRYFDSRHVQSLSMGMAYASGIVAIAVVHIFVYHPFNFECRHITLNVKTASCALLFRKALRLSKAALGKTTTGQMVNLLSNDVSRFDTSAIFLHYIWIGPLQTFIVLGILWNEIGPSCLAGIMLLLLFVPFQTWLGRVFSKLRMATAHRTDERVRLMHEIINAMRVIKMYTWERPFTTLTEAARRSELGVIMETNYYRAVNMSLFLTSSKVIIFVSLLTFVLTGNALTAEKVFVTSSLINNVRLVMTLFFPFAIAMGSETLISCKRIQEFLEMEEREDTNHVDKSNLRPKPKDCSLAVSGLTAKWSNVTEENTLTDVSFSVKAGELLAVVGPVGSGKGSLLNAILGELPAQTGKIIVKGKIAYASQEPWVFSGTVRQNILFGRSYDEKQYEKIIRVCALDQDFKELPDGDLTTVGERGMSLSGGQKARINLARAVYADADIYLLDDPLSAVDSHVSRHLFEDCIMKHLKHKVRILVTHQLQYLSSASEILVLKEGHMQALGPYHQLVNSGIDFGTLISEGQEEVSTLTQEPSGGKACKTSKAFMNGRILRERKRTESSSSAHQMEDSYLGSSVSIHDSVEADNILTISGAHTTGSSSTLTNSITTSNYASPQKQNRSEGKLRNSLDIETTKPLIVHEGNNNNARERSGNPEIRSQGSVKFRVYLKYFLAGGGWCVLLLLTLANILAQALFSGIDYWLAYWANGEQLKAQIVLNISSWEIGNSTNFSYSDIPEPSGYLDTTTNIYIYSGMTIGLFVLALGRTILFFMVCMKSSQTLHNNMFEAIIRVPIKFFDTHPVGQILNRFTKDLGQIDELLPITMFDVITIFCTFVGIIAIIAMVNVWLLLPTVFLGIIFIYLRRFYLCSARDVKRLEGITRSPVFTHLSTSLQGLTTIRAFEMQQEFMDEFDNHQDLHSSAWFLFLCTTRWFGICLDWLSCIYISVVTYSFMALPDSLGGDIGLAISSAMLLSGMFQWGVRQSAELENQMTSVERVLEYSSLEPEAPLETEDGKASEGKWPDQGDVVFRNVSLKYNEDESPVLKNLNFCIEGKEKIGIVGRTGAGKSSLITSLFRLTEPSGVIYIDNINIQELGLHRVRGSISIIPQDPTLFSGTMRKNLDPFHQYTDDHIWKALEEVQLKSAVSDMEGGLETFMSEGGNNLSVGQRQLVCLARAILRHNKILVLDEATANVDPRTDELIQQTIRTRFKDCTVFTIAHRLHTIMDSDRVMVLQAGQLMEFDVPHVLLNNENSIFYSLVQQTGKTAARQLHQIAEMAHLRRRGTDEESSSSNK
ncbi:ATP-binding cassette sub-family C member 4-like isoform X2 [Eriocheir sinensis]|uniref:ATP-binding cassette sub-family C member 4-like isoform X2 n=1 Tax=Eriocheir sinensis TaxID=95602 RepID=UPI0021C5686B|nr:ATP-binding cassette sub-family C member 4-like isoform X2 [Eriocheir sinensis]